jgi:hypothetical protein
MAPSIAVLPAVVAGFFFGGRLWMGPEVAKLHAAESRSTS